MVKLDAPFDLEAPRYVIEEPLSGRIIGDSAPRAYADPEPWQMTRLAYQESRALRVAGGLPILNARDGRDHEAAVRQAAAQGLPVPPHVLAQYGLAAVDAYGRACSASDSPATLAHEHAGWRPAGVHSKAGGDEP